MRTIPAGLPFARTLRRTAALSFRFISRVLPHCFHFHCCAHAILPSHFHIFRTGSVLHSANSLRTFTARSPLAGSFHSPATFRSLRTAMRRVSSPLRNISFSSLGLLPMPAGFCRHFTVCSALPPFCVCSHCVPVTRSPGSCHCALHTGLFAYHQDVFCAHRRFVLLLFISVRSTPFTRGWFVLFTAARFGLPAPFSRARWDNRHAFHACARFHAYAHFARHILPHRFAFRAHFPTRLPHRCYYIVPFSAVFAHFLLPGLTRFASRLGPPHL